VFDGRPVPVWADDKGEKRGKDESKVAHTIPHERIGASQGA
jgi:hypothetical protein